MTLALARLIAGNVLFGSGLFFHAFLYNYYVEALGHPEAVMGDAASALTLGGLLALLPAGWVSDRVGARATLVGAAAVATLGLALGAIVAGPAAIYLAAALAGVGGGIWRVAVPPELMRLTTPASRPRAFAWNVGLLVASGGLGMAVAGSIPDVLTAVLGAPRLTALRVALLLGAAGTAVGGFAFVLLPSGGRRRPGDPSPPQEPGVPATWDAALVVIVVAVGAWMLGPALMAPFFNIFFTRTFDLELAEVGMVFATSHLFWGAVVLVSGGLAARYGTRRVLALSLAAFAPAMWGLAAVGSLPVAVGLYLLQGAVSPLTNPLIDQLLLERVAPERHGMVSSWRNAAADLSAMLGASLGGRVLTARAFSDLVLFSGAVGAAGATFLVLAMRGPAGAVASCASEADRSGVGEAGQP